MNTKTIYTFESFNDVFPVFNIDKERIRYISNNYNKKSIADAFSAFYKTEIKSDVSDSTNNIVNIEIGKSYWGNVEQISKSGIVFTIPGVKEEIVTKENFSDCIDNIRNYLITHDNKLKFEVREKRRNVFYVSVLNAYYNMWVEAMDRAAKKFTPIDVHIDSLTKGGYLCHTEISSLNNLTGKNYTSLVFIPGSNIVLNIERDFEKWIGEDVQIIPQKFVKFKQNNLTGEIENSLIGSRKLVLQQLGNNNLYDIYNKEKLLTLNGENYSKQVFDGTVTGIINSNKKTGIFIELNGLYITGLLPIESSELLEYKPGDQIKVQVKQFEVQEGKEPFVLNKQNQVIYSNTRCVFELVK